MIKSAIKVDTEICTLKLARNFLKTVTNHKLETLQKELNLSVQDSHSALGDVRTCRELLLHLMQNFDVTLDNLLARQGIPTMLHTMPFGKHKGRVIANIAPDYRAWLLNQEIDADLRYTLEKLKGI
jgi:DNA polymerase-3 subunit epsilon